MKPVDRREVRSATPGGAFKAPVRIGVDIGGTFTDVVVVDANGAVHAFKSPSDVADPAAGAVQACAIAARGLGCELAELLGACALFFHGSTVATNTLLEKKGARVGLLTTAGFRDSLEIRRSIRADPWDHRSAYPEVLVPRYLRLPVGGRLDAAGKELTPLDLGAVERAVDELRAEGVESLAICFLHSYANPAHEHRAREFVRERWPEVWISCSADIAPAIGEYERTSTAVVNAYVAPRVIPYVRALEERLKQLGMATDLLLILSNGGAVSVAELVQRPVQLLLSGPAAGVSAIRECGRDVGNDKLVMIEVGGTSCDVLLSVGGTSAMAEQIIVDGYHLTVPAVEIHTVGAGGGTLAGVDAGGLMHAGPAGAGAVPGPAAYGLGGERPTVTDAQLVLGRLKAGPYADGALTLDRQRAERAVARHVAEPLGLSVAQAAAGIVRLVEQSMRHAVETVSVERGHNPRLFSLVAAGGAGPLHGVPVARSLGCRTVYVPRLAGVFCAFGMCHADVRHDSSRAYLRDLDEDGGAAAMQQAFAALESPARQTLEREGFGEARMRLERSLDLRYAGQQWTIRVPVDAADAPDARRVRDAFDVEHRRLYGYAQAGARIEVVNLHVTATGTFDSAGSGPTMHDAAGARTGVSTGASSDAAPHPIETRPVWIDEAHGVMTTTVYDGASLRPGHTIAGPAIVNERTTTLLVGVGDVLRVSAFGNYVIDLDAASRDNAERKHADA
ncbi:MAG: hydantoinase/oxoprolinase family protein [Burkholderiaceae bacterium]